MLPKSDIRRSCVAILPLRVSSVALLRWVRYMAGKSPEVWGKVLFPMSTESILTLLTALPLPAVVIDDDEHVAAMNPARPALCWGRVKAGGTWSP